MQANFVSLRPKLETVLAPVSYRSSRRRRQRKRLGRVEPDLANPGLARILIQVL